MKHLRLIDQSRLVSKENFQLASLYDLLSPRYILLKPTQTFKYTQFTLMDRFSGKHWKDWTEKIGWASIICILVREGHREMQQIAAESSLCLLSMTGQ